MKSVMKKKKERHLFHLYCVQMTKKVLDEKKEV